jgi:putative endonuclease
MARATWAAARRTGSHQRATRDKRRRSVTRRRLACPDVPDAPLTPARPAGSPPEAACLPSPAPAPAPPDRPADARRALGRQGEDLALAHLRGLGFEALARNHRTRHGEIDLIVFDGRTLVFVEVKTRRVRTGAPGAGPAPERPLEGWHARQRLRLRRLAAAWLADVRPRVYAAELRFDVIGVVLDGGGRLFALEHLEGAL